MSTSETITYRPSRQEAREIAASKSADIVMDRADLAALIRSVASLQERQQRAARGLTNMGEELAGLRDTLEILRLQL